MHEDMEPVRLTGLPGEITSITTARQLLRVSCADHQDPAVLADAQLLVSELVANAVVHGRGPIELEV